MENNIKVILNGKSTNGYKGESVLQLAKRNNIIIPTLCNDERLKPFTSCYLCVVEIQGMKGLQPACSTKIADGMVIETDNPKIHKARKAALELILSNHFADCIGPCKQTCPAGVDVQGYISLIEKKMYAEAISLIKETNPLPAICGRVCVRPCEIECRRNFVEGKGVGIDYLKRFVADINLNNNEWKPKVKPPTGKKVAIIGGGPAGLSAAFFLQKEGHHTDIFEAAPEAGGWLRYGIPEYRLPKDILKKEIDNIISMGAKIFYNSKLGSNVKYEHLKSEYDAILLAIGSQASSPIGCEGEDAENVLSGIDFLKNMQLTGKIYDFTNKTVAVIGGGNTAMDCCRTAIRCGAKKVYVIYRRTEKEMPANPIEIHESKLEGVNYIFLTAPIKINKDKYGKVKSLTCIKMQLGEPDASGRRRPIPIENSEFEIELDIILAAIGQKTIVDFIDDVNNNINNDKEKLQVNKWGNIDVNPDTLQTGVKNIFAAGDGVTGAATLIQAIAQARIAAHSINLFLQGQPVTSMPKEFLSKKENFRKLNKEDFIDKYAYHERQEMPTLPPEERKNFAEIELGYPNEEIAIEEANRCLECGCTEYYTCKLKQYATEYNASQINYSGEFNEYNIDFRHPFIEIDNNKCILCARCIRICDEVVGASALGFVNRGFKTYVAPSLGASLLETSCESCGLCISTCPTGAITENYYFKPGPIKYEQAYTICNYCSIGCKIELNHKNGFVFRVNGAKGQINSNTNICGIAKFAYHHYNDNKRITKPLIKKQGKFIPVSFEEALNLIAQSILNTLPNENGFFIGARLTNEEMYLIQKLARFVVKTNNISSFHYLERGKSYFTNSNKNVPFEELKNASKFYVLGNNIFKNSPVLGYELVNIKKIKNIPIKLISTQKDIQATNKANETFIIKNYYYFIKAVNHYLLSKNLENQLFIKDRCKGFDNYKDKLLTENFETLCEKAAISPNIIIEFAEDFNKEINAILIFSENEITAAACTEIINLSMLTGKLGKTSTGIIALKEKNNSHGLIDMGISPEYGVGAIKINNPKFIEKINNVLKISNFTPSIINNMKELLDNKMLKNIFIFGEDPIGCAYDKEIIKKWLYNVPFKVVQDYFITETAEIADIILPASFPVEIGGSFTNTQHIIQTFTAYDNFKNAPASNSLKQISTIINYINNTNIVEDANTVLDEITSLITTDNENSLEFKYTENDSITPLFKYGCDYLTKRAYDYFYSQINKNFHE